MSMNIHTRYMQVEDSIVRSQAVFHQHGHSEYAHVLVDVPDPIFCWAEICIRHGDAVSKIHLNEGSLEVSLWRQKKRKGQNRLCFFWESLDQWGDLDHNWRIVTRSDVTRGKVVTSSTCSVVSKEKVTPLLRLTQVHCEGGVLQNVCCSPAFLIARGLGDLLENILAPSPGFP